MKIEELPCPTTNSRSQIHALLAAIAAEQASAELGLHGYAEGTSKHQFITARMESMGKHAEQLVELVGDRDEAMQMVLDQMNRSEQQGESCHAS